jgi:O-antigen ligase
LRGGAAALWLGFLAWTFASLLWADDPALTLRRLVVLAILVVAAVGVATRLSCRDLAWLSWVGGVLVILVGAAFEVALGTFTPWESGYRFAGLMNPIGTAMMAGALVLAVALLYSGASGAGRLLLLGSAALALLTMLLTRSRGPTGALLAGLVVQAAVVWPRIRFVVALCACTVIGSLAVIAAGDLITDALPKIALLGREGQEAGTLTGRVPMWEEVMGYVTERPLLGYGYNGFWTPERFVAIAYATGFYVADVHNSYLGLLLGMGYPGLALALGAVLSSAVRAVQLHRSGGDPAAAFALALIVSHLINGLLLSVFLAEQFSNFLALCVMARFAVVTPTTDAT